VLLGFIPEGGPDPVSSGIAAPLGSILEQLSRGGGAKGVNIQTVSATLITVWFCAPVKTNFLLSGFQIVGKK
jgi:hypothetical protein